MTDPMELADRLEEWAKEIALDGTPSQIGPSASDLTQAAARIREMVDRLDRWEPKLSAPSVSCGTARIIAKQAADPTRRLNPLPPAPGAEA